MALAFLRKYLEFRYAKRNEKFPGPMFREAPSSEGVGAAFVLIEAPHAFDSVGTGFEMISDADVRGYYTGTSQVRPSKEDLVHEVWLGKLERGRDGSSHILLEAGPHRHIRRVPIEWITASSKVLFELSEKPQYTRHLWLKDLHIDYLDTYLTYMNPRYRQTVEDFADIAWEESVALAVSADRLQDDPVRSLALSALRMKALCTECFPERYLDVVAASTEESSRIRHNLLDLDTRDEGGPGDI